jgi:hypothetical protein
VNALQVLACIAGTFIVLGTASSVVRNLVVPRARSGLARFIGKSIRHPLSWITAKSPSYERRDRILTFAAPLTILVTLVVWLILFIVGYGLLLFSISHLGLGAALREAGSSVLTLGFVTTSRGQLTTLDYAAAITGPLVIGLQVGYLPALYGAYNRREAEVTMLDSRAGEPSWWPEILARHASISSLDNLADLYRGWERWAADVSESHANYPVLIFFRSQAPTRNWLVALLSVMDSAALMLALNPSRPQGEPRMAARMGFVCMRDLARTTRIPYDPDPDPDADIQLTYEEYLHGIDRLERAGFPMERTAEAAWPDFKGWRINYESIAYRLAWSIDAVPALWSGPRRGPEASVAPKTPADRRPTRRGK